MKILQPMTIEKMGMSAVIHVANINAKVPLGMLTGEARAPLPSLLQDVPGSSKHICNGDVRSRSETDSTCC
jgi:hypothetical protein